jgi:hypothetical protein
VGPTETQGYLLWLDNEPAQAALLRINEVLDRHPGSFFGYYGDHFLQAVVVTVEPAEAEPLRFLPELEDAAGSALRVIFRPACRSRADLEVVRVVLEAREWHPNAGSINFGSYIDASNSRLVVSLPSDATAEAATLHTRFGDLVYVVWIDQYERPFPEPALETPAETSVPFSEPTGQGSAASPVANPEPAAPLEPIGTSIPEVALAAGVLIVLLGAGWMIRHRTTVDADRR